MGAWGAKIFENDMALDLVGDFEDEGVAAVADALSTVLQGEDSYIDADDGSAALAAAAFVAAALGKTKHLNPTAAEAFNAKTSDVAELSVLSDKAVQALDAVLSDGSELLELWQEADEESEADDEGLKEFTSSIAQLKLSLRT